jgi:hypothetical protein
MYFMCLNMYTPRRMATPFELSEEKEGQFIAKVAKEASINARNETFRHGRPVMTVQGEHIVRMFEDGSTELVRKIGFCE